MSWHSVFSSGSRSDASRHIRIAPEWWGIIDRRNAVSPIVVCVRMSAKLATNTTIAREPLTADPAQVAAMGAGGLSGAPLQQRSLAVLRTVRAVVPQGFCVISAGGVETAADVQGRLDAGATLVQGYTAFIYRGPLWAREINRALASRG